MMLFPQNFENIYLGETFSCYVCVHNESSQVAKDVCVKVDLQTGSQRVSLPLQWSTEAAPDGRGLSPAQTLGYGISHEVKEVGQHILVCAVTYNNNNGENQYFRKFFKFSVAKPLDVKTKFYNGESDEVFLEAQIQNTTHLPMCMERVSLEPSEYYSCTPLNGLDTARDGSIFDTLPYLPPSAARQYLYQMKPKPEVAASLRGVTPLGRLEMVWRTTMGEKGRLQTSQLQRVVPGYGDVRLTVDETPGVVKLRQAYRLVCRLHNCSERNLDLVLSYDESCLSGLVMAGVSNRSLGIIPQNESLRISLTLIPVVTGLQTVSGVRLTDKYLGRTYEHDEIAQVFVYA
jgi:hypothetical protein